MESGTLAGRTLRAEPTGAADSSTRQSPPVERSSTQAGTAEDASNSVTATVTLTLWPLRRGASRRSTAMPHRASRSCGDGEVSGAGLRRADRLRREPPPKKARQDAATPAAAAASAG